MSKKTRKRAKRRKITRKGRLNEYLKIDFDLTEEQMDWLLEQSNMIKINPNEDIWKTRILEMKKNGIYIDNDSEIFVSQKEYNELINNELNGDNNEL